MEWLPVITLGVSGCGGLLYVAVLRLTEIRNELRKINRP